MQALSRDEFLDVLGLTSGAFDQLQHGGHVALAFGMPMPATPGRYLDLDLVAMAINIGLIPSLGREKATTIVAGFFHQWASAVGHSEKYKDRDYFMTVAWVGARGVKKDSKLLLVTNGTLDDINQDFRDMKDLVRFFVINVSDIIRRLRAKAQSAGIDLSRPFFFLPDDPQFEQFLTQFKRERDARLTRLKRDKKKLAVARQRARHEGISAPPRVATETAFANIM